MFSEGEQSCISGQVGEATYQGMLSQPLAAVIGVPSQLDMVLDCVAPEKAAELAIIGIGAVAGGFTDESAMCLRTLYATSGVSNIALGGSEDPQEDSPRLSLLPLPDRRGSAGAFPVHGHPRAVPPVCAALRGRADWA